MASFSTFKTLEDALLHFKIVENQKSQLPFGAIGKFILK